MRALWDYDGAKIELIVLYMLKKGICMWKLPKKYREKEILYRRLILFTLSLGLIVVYFSQILGLIGSAIWICLPFIIGGILAFALNTLCRVIIRLTGKAAHKTFSEKSVPFFKAATVLIVLMVLVLVFVYVIPALISSAQKIVTELPEKLAQLIDKIYARTEKVPMIHSWLDENQEVITDIPKLVTSLFSFITTGTAGDALSSMKNFISSTVSWIWILFLSVMFSFIAFFNTRQFVNEGKLIAKAYMPEWLYRVTADLVKLVSRIFSQYLGGTVLECIILASLVSIGGLIFQIPNAILVGVVCGICALVPMFGATAGAILCTLFLFLDSPGKAITFLIMFICLQQIEGNFIYPNVVGKSVGLPAMYVVVAITIGASVAGILGMILSIPVFSVLYELITQHARQRVDDKEALMAAEGADETDFSDTAAGNAVKGAIKETRILEKWQFWKKKPKTDKPDSLNSDDQSNQ